MELYKKLPSWEGGGEHEQRVLDEESGGKDLMAKRRENKEKERDLWQKGDGMERGSGRK